MVSRRASSSWLTIICVNEPYRKCTVQYSAVPRSPERANRHGTKQPKTKPPYRTVHQTESPVTSIPLTPTIAHHQQQRQRHATSNRAPPNPAVIPSHPVAIAITTHIISKCGIQNVKIIGHISQRLTFLMVHPKNSFYHGWKE